MKKVFLLLVLSIKVIDCEAQEDFYVPSKEDSTNMALFHIAFIRHVDTIFVWNLFNNDYIINEVIIGDKNTNVGKVIIDTYYHNWQSMDSFVNTIEFVKDYPKTTLMKNDFRVMLSNCYYQFSKFVESIKFFETYSESEADWKDHKRYLKRIQKNINYFNSGKNYLKTFENYLAR